MGSTTCSVKRKKKRYHEEQRILGLGPDGWEVLGRVDPYIFISPQLLFRKIFKPKSPDDYSFYYSLVVVAHPTTHRKNLQMGSRTFYIHDWDTDKASVTATFPPATEIQPFSGNLFYQVTVVFDIRQGVSDE